MANITKRVGKNGELSFLIKVYKGRDISGKQLKPYVMTWKPSDNMTPKQIEKELQRQATLFEEQCKTGQISDNKQTFAQYAEYVINLKERTGIKHKTIVRYKELIKRINEGIGHLKISDIKPQHLNNLYEQLGQNGLRKNSEKALCKVELKSILIEAGMTKEKLSKLSGVALQTISMAYKKNIILLSKAEAISEALDMPVKSLFKVIIDDTPLSNKTITEHHRLISTILGQAEKELLIMYNPARKATPPKPTHTQPNYFQPEDIEKIRICLDKELLKWKTITHLFLITGARRGEIAGLKWEAIEWKKSQIHICNNLLYSADRGLYEDTTKTESSDRFITLPKETMALLKEYRKWYLEQSTNYGDRWHNTNYLFFQEKSGHEGMPLHPDTITEWLDSFSKRYELPHINPHAFRHTMASVLYFNGVDSISISKRLGHAKVSTTTDIYSHIIKKADEQNAEVIADIILRPIIKQA